MLNNKEYINKLYQSDKALIIYKVKNGFDIYTDLKEKIIVKNSNLKEILKPSSQKKNTQKYLI